LRTGSDVGAVKIAALIAEPIQGNGGIVVPPPGYWRRIRELCHQQSILLVFDEVQTGFNRTGRWFAGEHWDVAPDIMTVAKALGNGFPIAAFITTDEIASSYTRPGASTLGGNPVSASAALATIDYHEEHELGNRAAESGEWFLAQLTPLAEGHACIDHVRGKGLMIGADIVDQDGQPAPGAMDDLLEGLRDRGFLCGKTGAHRNVLTIMPPLTVVKEDLQSLLATLDELLVSVPVSA
jgi:4-aminobutyrate aminotransferase-like enzyme